MFHPPWFAFVFAASLLLLSPGCGSDFSLAPEALRGDEEDPVPFDRPDTPRDPGDPPDPEDLPDPEDPSLWDEFEPGSMPDLYFAVAHHDYDCPPTAPDPESPPIGLDLSSGSEGRTDVSWALECSATYAVMDIEGQVVAEFEIPQPANDVWTYMNHVELRPAGPGKFLAVVENWGDVNGWENGFDRQSDGFWVSPYVQVWLADAVDGSLTLLMEMQDEHTAVLQTNGRRVSLDPDGITGHIGVWPDPDVEKIVLWGGNPTCESGVSELRAVELGSAPVLDWVWQPEDLLAPTAFDRCAYQPFALHPGIDEDGAPSMLLGTAQVGSTGEVEYGLAAWSPEHGPMWDVVADGLSWPPAASYAAWDGGAVLFMSGVWSGPQSWHVMGPEVLAEGEVPGDLTQVRPGPLLDPVAPTFMMVGRDPVDEMHTIKVVHRGDEVWSIDRLRFGLDPQRRFISDVVLLVPVPEGG